MDDGPPKLDYAAPTDRPRRTFADLVVDVILIIVCGGVLVFLALYLIVTLFRIGYP